MPVSLRKPQIATNWHYQLNRLHRWPVVPGSKMDERRSQQIEFLRGKIMAGEA